MLEYIIRQALPKPEWEVVRADEEKDPGSITQMVIKRIVTSDLIVADLTDHNPNVFYELAVAHGYKKPVVTIMTDGQKVPFDIVDMRTVFYDLTNPASVHSAKERLVNSAKHVLENPTPTNPLVGYEMFSTAGNRDASPSDKLEFGMTQILSRLSHIESRLPDTRPSSALVRPSRRSPREIFSPKETEERREEIRSNLRALNADLEVLKDAEDDQAAEAHRKKLYRELEMWMERARRFDVDLDRI
ncbi:MAG: hypothetical protein EOP24_27445 [Hyphomicrobiales bacterium]|nr:MAG: hypothetical protein EOP24_27445 [Hyphomicrobiales bacterium]